jgi:hypothetical protein
MKCLNTAPDGVGGRAVCVFSAVSDYFACTLQSGCIHELGVSLKQLAWLVGFDCQQ